MSVTIDETGLRRRHRAARRLRWNLVNRAFHLAARVGGYAAELRAAKSEVEVIQDIAYGPHPVAHTLDVFRPRYAPRPLPVMLYIHGGAFTLCSKDTHRGIAMLNARHGQCLVFNINYRLAPAYPFPAAIEDACDAYRWVVEHARQYGGDPSRIVVAGESAGGNLALGVAVAASYPRPEPYAKAVYALNHRPCAVMPIMPYLQVSNPARYRLNPGVGRLTMNVVDEIARIYLGHRHGQAGRDTLMADPVRILEECGAPARKFPEVWSGVGTVDLCYFDVQRLKAACERHGIPVTAQYYEGEVHAFHALRWRPAAKLFWRTSLEFIRRAAAAPVQAAAEAAISLS